MLPGTKTAQAAIKVTCAMQVPAAKAQSHTESLLGPYRGV
jgi:hypothetical protein